MLGKVICEGHRIRADLGSACRNDSSGTAPAALERTVQRANARKYL
jgi:hypothetical protein